MLNLAELEQFCVFAEAGTLAKAAEKLHISQPTITRSMQHLERDFGASLFKRERNRIELNETGQLALEYAKKILFDTDKAVNSVRAFDQSLRTIIIASCAPAPLWSLLPALSDNYREKTISSQILPFADILHIVKNEHCALGVLPFASPDPSLLDQAYLRENLSVCVPKNQELSHYNELSLADLNGFNCLLRDHIGFWTDLVRTKMPSSRFLIQTDEFAFLELIRSSTLLCFTTNLADLANDILAERKIIPITDSEAQITYHLICRKEKQMLLKNIPSPTAQKRLH